MLQGNYYVVRGHEHYEWEQSTSVEVIISEWDVINKCV